MTSNDLQKQRPCIYFNVHLVSDATGETLNAVLRASSAQFGHVQALEHNYYLVRSEKQLQRVMREIEGAPGIVWHTIANPELRQQLVAFCQERAIPTLPVLDQAVHMLSRHLGIAATDTIAGQHRLNTDYFDRMEALNFSLAHDDGQNVEGLHHADVILIGVSRTSKTPTCVYLGNRGVRAGNIPLVPGVPLPSVIDEVKRPLIIGLKISPERLTQIRQQRLIALNEDANTSYADGERVRSEVTEANRLFQKKKWPVIDVSRRSVEETAAAILNILSQNVRP
ncbi:MAG: pyruvate, water dikinase regulatory protein [Pseudomonadota bacterium]